MYVLPHAPKARKLLLIALPFIAVALFYGVFEHVSGRSHPSPSVQSKSIVKVASPAALRPSPVLPSSPPPPSVPTHDYTISPTIDGTMPVISRIPTTEKVAFLTIDDGIVTNPSDLQLMQATNVKATFFLVYRFIHTDYSFFDNLATQTGSDIENHTYDHFLLTNLNYDQQKLDICKNADVFNTWFGKRPVLLRPSGGAYNTTTLRAAADCGMKALVMWDATINNGVIKYQNGSSMRPGDIVLMHFRSTFQEDLNAFVQAAQSSGLQPDLLINWL